MCPVYAVGHTVHGGKACFIFISSSLSVWSQQIIFFTRNVWSVDVNSNWLLLKHSTHTDGLEGLSSSSLGFRNWQTKTCSRKEASIKMPQTFFFFFFFYILKRPDRKTLKTNESLLLRECICIKCHKCVSPFQASEQVTEVWRCLIANSLKMSFEGLGSRCWQK